jgi:hypothetical protein
MQKREPMNSRRQFGLFLALMAIVGCSGGEQAPRDGVQGNLALDGAAAQMVDGTLTASSVAGKSYQCDSDGLLGGVRLRIVQTNPAAAAVGTFSLTGSPNIAVTFEKSVGVTNVSALPTAGTIEITHIPTAADPVWTGVLRSVEASFSGGPQIALSQADFRVTFQAGMLQ